jgi:hypothetical protein
VQAEDEPWQGMVQRLLAGRLGRSDRAEHSMHGGCRACSVARGLIQARSSHAAGKDAVVQGLGQEHGKDPQLSGQCQRRCAQALLVAHWQVCHQHCCFFLRPPHHSRQRRGQAGAGCRDGSPLLQCKRPAGG